MDIMNKCMIAAVAAVAMAGMVSDVNADVTSANVVG